jgi:hypothetical protein
VIAGSRPTNTTIARCVILSAACVLTACRTDQRSTSAGGISPGAEALPPDDTVEIEPTDDPSIQELNKHHDYLMLPKQQRLLARRVFRKLAPQWRQSFVGCLERRIGGRSALLDRGQDGITLLEQIAPDVVDVERATPEQLQPMELAGSLLHECAEPGVITQGEGLHNTCTVAAVQYLLLQRSPAELARIVRSVAFEGSARIRNGRAITRVEDSLTRHRYVLDTAGKYQQDAAGPIPDPRNLVDRLFQAAMMDYANGSDRYSDKDDRSYADDGSYRGLSRRQQEVALEGVLGRPFRAVSGENGMRALERAVAAAPAMVDVHWLDGAESHAVVVERIEGGRVYMKNTLRFWPGPRFPMLTRPLRKVEDHQGRESMPLEDFERIFQCAYVPDYR